jgi:hypothetical protein
MVSEARLATPAEAKDGCSEGRGVLSVSIFPIKSQKDVQ